MPKYGHTLLRPRLRHLLLQSEMKNPGASSYLGVHTQGRFSKKRIQVMSGQGRGEGGGVRPLSTPL